MFFIHLLFMLGAEPRALKMFGITPRSPADGGTKWGTVQLPKLNFPYNFGSCTVGYMACEQLGKTRLVFMGTPEFALPSLAALAEAGARIVGVITQPNKPAGRGRDVRVAPVAKKAVALGLPLWKPLGWKREEDRAFLRDLQPELLAVVAYGHILPAAVLALARFGAVNVHASFLPKYRGAAPIPAAILSGDAETGVTIMKLDEGVDTGPLLAQEQETILPDDTAATLSVRLAERGARLLVPTLEAYLSGALTPTPQDHTRATHAPRITKENGRIDWLLPAHAIERAIRAYTPWPHAYTPWEGKTLMLHAARVLAEPTKHPAGTVFQEGEQIMVATGAGTLLLRELQLEGRARLPADVFVRGYPRFIGSRLG